MPQRGHSSAKVVSKLDIIWTFLKKRTISRFKIRVDLDITLIQRELMWTPCLESGYSYTPNAFRGSPA